MLQRDPSSRPTATALLAEPFLKQLNYVGRPQFKPIPPRLPKSETSPLTSHRGEWPQVVTAAKRISTKKLTIDKDSYPKSVLVNYQRETKVLRFHNYFSALSAVPYECFAFDRDVRINLRRTFERAEKLMDPVDIFKYYVELGNVSAFDSLWSRFDYEQKDRVYDCDDAVSRFLGDFLESRRMGLSQDQILDIYDEARAKNFNTSAFIFKLCPLPCRILILLSEFQTALQSGGDSWRVECEQLAGLVAI
uniref:Protein kinase domain-containing protein n=1 Tax=Steinernema glaseri TaxID=37863 RepID=A0A1I7ZJ20_9BILA